MARPAARYDPCAGATINIGLPSPLLSRFDVVMLMRDTTDEQRDTALTRHILQTDGAEPRRLAAGGGTQAGHGAGGGGGGAGGRAGGGGEEGEGAAGGLWGLEKLRAYLQYVKEKFDPVLSKDAERAPPARGEGRLPRPDVGAQ